MNHKEIKRILKAKSISQHVCYTNLGELRKVFEEGRTFHTLDAVPVEREVQNELDRLS